MMRVHSTWARGASAIAVPGCPLRAAWGASMARPRITLMARCSRAGSGVMHPPPYLPSPPPPSTPPARSPAADEDEAGGPPVQVAARAHRPDLAGAERAGHRVGADGVAHEPGVVVPLAEEGPPPAVAGEHERPARGAGRHGAGQRLPQVLVRRGGVPHVELDGRADRHGLAQGDAPDR